MIKTKSDNTNKSNMRIDLLFSNIKEQNILPCGWGSSCSQHKYHAIRISTPRIKGYGQKLFIISMVDDSSNPTCQKYTISIYSNGVQSIICSACNGYCPHFNAGNDAINHIKQIVLCESDAIKKITSVNIDLERKSTQRKNSDRSRGNGRRKKRTTCVDYQATNNRQSTSDRQLTNNLQLTDCLSTDHYSSTDHRLSTDKSEITYQPVNSYLNDQLVDHSTDSQSEDSYSFPDDSLFSNSLFSPIKIVDDHKIPPIELNEFAIIEVVKNKVKRYEDVCEIVTTLLGKRYGAELNHSTYRIEIKYKSIVTGQIYGCPLWTILIMDHNDTLSSIKIDSNEIYECCDNQTNKKYVCINLQTALSRINLVLEDRYLEALASIPLPLPPLPLPLPLLQQ